LTLDAVVVVVVDVVDVVVVVVVVVVVLCLTHTSCTGVTTTSKVPATGAKVAPPVAPGGPAVSSSPPPESHLESGRRWAPPLPHPTRRREEEMGVHKLASTVRSRGRVAVAAASWSAVTYSDIPCSSLPAHHRDILASQRQRGLSVCGIDYRLCASCLYWTM